jgi:hypothetical protein
MHVPLFEGKEGDKKRNCTVAVHQLGMEWKQCKGCTGGGGYSGKEGMGPVM